MSKYLLKILSFVAELYRDALRRESEAALQKVFAFDTKIERQHEYLDLQQARLSDLYRQKNEQAKLSDEIHTNALNELDRVGEL